MNNQRVFDTPPVVPPRTLEDGAREGGERKKDRDRDREKEKKKQKEDKRSFERGVETLFRTSYGTHQALTAMADGKANIMITINGLVMSVLIGSLSTRMDAEEWLLVPTSVLLLGCLASMIFAVLAVRPRVNAQVLTLEQVRREHANILFFGNYVHLSEAEYRQGVLELIREPDRLYSTMTRDLYGMGSVLSEKFRLLRHSYNIFMAGLAIGVLLFIGFYIVQVF